MGWLKDIIKGKEKVQPISINDQNFKSEIMESDLPVLLDIWTPSCTHCHKLEPIIMNIAQKYKGKLKVAEVNGAESPHTMASLNVRGTPTIIYFYKREEVERVVGFRGSLYHMDLIDNALLPIVDNERIETDTTIFDPAKVAP